MRIGEIPCSMKQIAEVRLAVIIVQPIKTTQLCHILCLELLEPWLIEAQGLKRG